MAAETPLQLASWTEPFPEFHWTGDLRPSQQAAVEVARRQLAEGKRRLHVVAPPGTGKTILGLYLWALEVRRPAVVLSPNTAIQMQWAQRASLFSAHQNGRPLEVSSLVSTDPEQPALLTSLTYQSVTLPQRGGDDLNEAALGIWRESLLQKGEALDQAEAAQWIANLKDHNPKYYRQRISIYRKQARLHQQETSDALSTLHRSSRQTLDRLHQMSVGLVIVDECHHLLGHWGRVLLDAGDLFEEPVVIGLTATPPDQADCKPDAFQRYKDLLGTIDYEVPVPAVVKDGFLAPYQDLAYFVRPSADELAYVARADEALDELIQELCQPAGPDPVHLPEQSEEQDQNPADSPVDPHTSDQSSDPHEDQPEGATFGTAEGANPSQEDETAPRARDGLVPLRKSGPSAETTELAQPAERAEPAQQSQSNKEAQLQPAEPLVEWVEQTLEELRLPTGQVRNWAAFAKRDPAFADAARAFLLRQGRPLPDQVPQLAADQPDQGDMTSVIPVVDRYIRHRLMRSANPLDHRRAQRAKAKLRLLGVQITETGSQPCASPVSRVLAYANSKAEALIPILAAEEQVLGERIRAIVVTDFETASAVSAEVEGVLDSESGGAVAAFRTLISHKQTDSLDPVLVTGSTVLVDDDLAPTFLHEARTWLKANAYDVELSLTEQPGLTVLRGRGSQWGPRLYIQLITELFQRGVTKCLVGTRGLLGEGWDAHTVNVLVDLTAVTTSTSVNQLRGRSIRLDPDEPHKVANNWDVVCLASEFARGLEDYRRFLAKHRTLYGVTDDGTIEKGVGHVHAALDETHPELIEGAVAALNDTMLKRAAQREEARKLWKIGEPFQAVPRKSIELEAPAGPPGSFPPFAKIRDPWNDQSLSLAVGRAVEATFQELQLISAQTQVQVNPRAGGFVRLFLEDCPEEEGQRFAEALAEVFGPLDQARYIIPREVTKAEHTWLSRVLPGLLGRYFQRHKQELAAWHAVPSAAARNRDAAAIFQKHWNAHVSPGEVVYAYREDSQTIIREALRDGLVSNSRPRQKDVFV